MLAGGVDVFVAEDVGDEVDVAGLAVEGRAVGAAELVRRYMVAYQMHIINGN